MRLQRKLTNEEWKEVVALGPGVHMFRGKKTLIYNGEKLRGERWEDHFIYRKEERESWEAIITLPGVEVIPYNTFAGCEKIETVIMSDTVRRVEEGAFYYCQSLSYVRLSKILEYIKEGAFTRCSLTSIFILPSCREICDWAFHRCHFLSILCLRYLSG